MRLVSTLVALATLAVAALPAAADQAPWLGPDWPVRRVVDVTVAAARGAAGSEVAGCAFFTGGRTRPDAGDIRVAVRGRQLVSHRVLQVGPGDFVRIAFAATPAETRYFIYYANPKADAPAAWEPQRGLLLETRHWPGGPQDKLTQVQTAWAKAQPLGADFVSHISFGFNPFVDSDIPALFHYTGWFVPPAPGTYNIATSSNGGSWVLIDGRPAVEWPGAHGALGDARHAKPVTLSAGVHRIDYWNVSAAGSVSTLAAWQSPAGGRFEPIPAKAFLPVAEASLVEMDVQGERMTADFFAENAGEAWWPDQYAVRMKFRNLSKSISAQQGGKFEWDFGDGQTSTLVAPTHIYLAPGEYPVTLKASRLADASTFRAKVAVARNWWKQTDPAMEPTKRYADEVALYSLPALETKCLLVAVSLFEREGMSGPVVAACTEALKRQGVVESQVQKLGLLAGEHLRKTGKADPAVAAYRAIEARLKSTVFKVSTAVQIGETLLHDLHRWDEAEKEYQRVLGTYGTSGADASLRRTHIGLGDIWRHRGDADKARRAYQAAAALKVVSFAPKEAAVRVGTLARYVEEYTREKQWEWAFKFLDDWAWEFPDDKLQGHWSYLKASALVARGDHAAALLEANDVLAAVPANPYAVRLLMLAADCYVTLGDKDKARLLLQTAAEDYPEDPDQSKAKQRLTTLGGPLTADKPKTR